MALDFGIQSEPETTCPSCKNEVAIICKGKPRQTKTSARAQAIGPFHQHPLQVMLDEWVFQHVSGGVSDQCRLRYRVFARSVVGIRFFAGLQRPAGSPGCPATGTAP